MQIQFLNSRMILRSDKRLIDSWGRMHEQYLKKNKRHTYDVLLMSGKLYSYLADIDEQVRDMFDNLVGQIKENEGLTEQLKEENQMEWVQRMDKFRHWQKRL